MLADLGPRLFLAWCAWTCVFTAAFIVVLALLNACSYIDRFTRFAGELFGMLIAVRTARIVPSACHRGNGGISGAGGCSHCS